MSVICTVFATCVYVLSAHLHTYISIHRRVKISMSAALKMYFIFIYFVSVFICFV